MEVPLTQQLGHDEIMGLAGMLMGAFTLACGAVVAIAAILAAHYRRMQRDDMEATLKMEMLERGMSAEDIERVLAARMSDPRGRNRFCGWQSHAARHKHAANRQPMQPAGESVR